MTSAPRVCPERIGELLPTSPVLTSTAQAWDGLVLQRYLHPTHEIELPPTRDHFLVVRLGGEALFECRDEHGRTGRYRTDTGYLSLAPAGSPVSRVIHGWSDILALHVMPSLLAEVAAASGAGETVGIELLSRVPTPDPQIEALGRRLLVEAGGGGFGTTLAADMLSRILALDLLRRHSNRAARLIEPRAPPLQGLRLRRTVDFIHEHLAEDLSLAALAAICGISASHFARVFRAATGEPPHRYVLRLRIDRARSLLERTELSIITIAFECGFEQPGHFAAMFRRMTGASPREWRRARRL